MVRTINKTTIDGLYELKYNRLEDNRGSFTKTFHEHEFQKYGLETNFKEQYFSTSKKGVFRGFHFQAPPEDHVKLVYCVQGKVLDIVIDIRKNSPTYGKYDTFELSEEKGNSVYIPKGCAHGFLVRSEQATLVYNVSTIYSPEDDMGIHWSSVNILASMSGMIISDRDNKFTTLEYFKSPFSYKEKL